MYTESIHEHSNATECQSYRPTAILPTISKIFEEIILRRLNQHFTKHNLLTSNQFAYQAGKGTVDAIKYLITTVGKALEEHNKCAAQLCDLSRAFDLMPHAAFLAKMEQYGVRGTALALIRSYLSNRLQRVKVDNVVSTFRESTVGVPQGSLLGGIFFIIYHSV